MKKNLPFLIAALSIAFTAGSQTLPHQPAPPPIVAGNSLLRSLTVDCADLIVNDIANGHVSGLESDLINYISADYIGYVILRDLENAGIFGDAVKESALSHLLGDIRGINPDIQIGVCGSTTALFQSNAFLNNASSFDKRCYVSNLIIDPDHLNSVINAPNLSGSDKKRTAIITFFLSVTRFMESELLSNRKNCSSRFDAFYIDYPYWNTTSSMANMQHDFENFKDILKVLQFIKCNSTCIRFIDAEFLPTDLFKLQGWTSIDQITEADPLIDRVVFPAYTNNASGAFNLRCKLMHYISDQFSKPGTKLFVKLNAESSSFANCNSTAAPNNYLGDYLNGTTFPSGNMYSVEKNFVSAFENPNYVCPACNCSTYTDNHYTSLNVQGNVLVGMIWTPYSMLQSNQLYRKKINPIPEISENNPVEIRDVTGKTFGIFKNVKESEEAIKQYPGGMYFIVGNGNLRKWVKVDRN